MLSSEHGRFELCKDVAAFANAQGGLLACGVAAKKQGDRALEVAEKLQPFPRRMADIDRYIDVLNELLRPRVTISHHWYQDPGSSDQPEQDAAFYLAIEIAPVPEADQFVIVRRTLNDKTVFGSASSLATPARVFHLVTR